jgi:hypothetical protein
VAERNETILKTTRDRRAEQKGTVMESRTFDRFVSRFNASASRRGVVRGLVGTAASALAGGALLEASAGNAAGKRRRRRAKGGHGAVNDFVAICHVTGNGQGIERLQVQRRALRKHLAHGDFQHVDCCVNADCDAGACFSAQCVSGTCSVTQLPQGTACDLPWPLGGIGGCTASGLCVPAATAGG